MPVVISSEPIKNLSIHILPNHMLKLLLQRNRSAYAKFRCGVAPLKIETCRYGLNRIPVEERLCESCKVVEDEVHVMMVCPLFNVICSQFILQLNEVEQRFNDYTQEEQFIYVMSNTACYKIISKAISFLSKNIKCSTDDYVLSFLFTPHYYMLTCLRSLYFHVYSN